MRNKYGNIKITIDGIRFDSKAEGRRYCELKILLKADHISNLVLQPRFLLQESYKKNGKAIRKIEYVADFMYIDDLGFRVIEDVKGMKNQIYLLKKKLFEYKYSELEITEIK